MKAGLYAVIGMILFLSACDKTESESYSLHGRYVGIFQRTGSDTAQVNIIFDQNQFEGSSNKTAYPAICKGNFDIESNTVSFSDDCAWTADFDWTLILTGTYNLQINDGTVRIWRTSGTVTDEYLLRQPLR